MYPELEQEKYEPGYRGSIREDTDGKWLEISEIAAGKELSLTDIRSFLQKNRYQAPFDGISIIRSDGVGTENRQLVKILEKDLVNQAAEMLNPGGKLEFFFRESHGGNRMTKWSLSGLREAEADKDAEITALKKATGVWSLTLRDEDFPAEFVEAVYSEPGLSVPYGEQQTENVRPIYYYQEGNNGKDFWHLQACMSTSERRTMSLVISTA